MKKKIMLLVISLILLLPLSVSAEEKLEITGCSAVRPGKTVKCTVTASSSSNISGAMFTAKVENNLISIESIEKDSSTGWNGTANNPTLQVDKPDGAGNNAVVGYITLKAGETEGTDKITLIDTEVDILEDGTFKSITDVKVNGADITVSNSAPDSETDGTGNDTNTDTVNPQTTDVNILVIILSLVVCSTAVIVGKKKLNKISK